MNSRPITAIERASDNTLLLSVMERLKELPEASYFNDATRLILQVLNVHGVLLAKGLDCPVTEVRTFGLCVENPIPNGCTYALRDAPCHTVYREKSVCFSDGTARQFPQFCQVVGFRVENYLAVPLSDDCGEIIGHVAILDRKSIANPAMCEAILRILAVEFEARNSRRESALVLSQYEQLVSTSDDFMSIVGLDYRYKMVNDHYLTTFGKPREQVIGHPVAEIIGDELFQTKVKQRLDSCFAGERVEVEVPVHLPGSVGFLYARYHPHYHPDGTIIGAVIVIRDISQNKEYEDILRQYEQIVSSSNDSIAVLNCNYTYQLVNQKFLEIQGKLSDEVIGRKVAELVGTEQFESAIKPAIDRSFAGESVELEIEIAHQNKWVVIDVHYNPHFDQNGRVSRVVEVGRDITQRKKTEKSLLHIATGTSSSVSFDFFESLVGHLAETLNVEYALACEFEKNHSDRVRTIAFWAEGKIQPGGVYSLHGTPCGSVLGKVIQIYNGGLQRLFPDDQFLADINAESYAGAPLFDSTGSPLGVISIMNRQALQFPELVESTLQIFAIRAASELERMRYEKELRKKEERFQLISRATRDAIYDWDITTGKVWRNENYPHIVGNPETIGNDRNWWEDHLHPDQKANVLAGIDTAFRSGSNVWTGEYQFLRGDGSYADLLDRGYILYDRVGKPVRMIGSMTDLSERTTTERALQRSQERLRTLYDDTPSMFFTVNRQGTILSANRYGAIQLGYSVNELIGSPVVNLFYEADRSFVECNLGKCFDEPNTVHRWELRKVQKGGKIIWVRETARQVNDEQYGSSVLMVCEDISETYRLSQQLSYQATHDELTGLVNRREFERRLNRVVRSENHESSDHVLCYMDLDQFKIVNDTCGHLAGDELLRQLSELLRDKVRKRDTLARLGGDEFALLMEHCSLDQGTQVANSFLQVVEDFRFVWDEKKFALGVSIGLVPICDAESSSEEIMSAADAACYAAKDAGRHCIHIFSPANDQVAKRRGEMQWVRRINLALDDNLFRLHAQPIAPVDERFEQGEHYELLIRMKDFHGRLIPPGAFLPAAERYNLSQKIDRWVIQHAFEWLSRHPIKLNRLYQCAINLSGLSLGNEPFLEFLLDKMETCAIPPEKLCFEITETVAVANLTDARHFIGALKAKGCQFALDDFGSGVSSFGYLKSLPVDYLKIDGSFVRDIVDDPIDFAMVRSINEIGHVMGKKTIAECVESDAIIEKLGSIGVDYIQGYAIGKPVALKLP